MLRRPIISAVVVALLGLSGPSFAQDGTAGAYLAARLAGADGDYEAAARYYDRLIALGAEDLRTRESAMLTYAILGDFDKAAAVADGDQDLSDRGQLTSLVKAVALLEREDYDAVLALLDSTGAAGPLLDGLIRGWVRLAQGNMTGSLEAFADLSETEAFESFEALHTALALAFVGDLERADDILSGRERGEIPLAAMGIEAHAQILTLLDRREDAIALLEQTLTRGRSAELEDLLVRLQAGAPVTFDVIETPKQGMAEAFVSIAAIVSGEASRTYTLLHSQAASVLDPTNVDALLLTSSLFEEQRNYTLAERALASVPRDHPVFVTAEVSRAEILLADDRADTAVEVLKALGRDKPDTLQVYAALGDVLRRLDRFEEASEAYNRAVELTGEPEMRDWFLFYARAITYERTDRWEQAEADFRFALELNPDQPNVLNYLGYSLVEQKRSLDEALEMIKTAVDARPDSGYITDSLGWVYYRLGRYDEAVEPMEKAVELEPLDPVINDHLGDVYWAVGRKLEAEFQWKRALSFLGPEDEDHEANPARIRRKLEVGLDVVLEEEGAPALSAAE